METPKPADELTTADTAKLEKPPLAQPAPSAEANERDPTVVIPELVLPSAEDTL